MRWRLMSSHYLNVPGIEWEYVEQATGPGRGKQARKRFPVGLLLNPEDPNDHNYPGEIIVCREGKGHPKDIIFVGPPTPEMEPLDEEAQAETAKESVKWSHPIEGLPGQGELYSQSLLSSFERALDEIAKGRVPIQVPNTPVDADGARLAALEAQVAQLMEINKALMEERAAGPVEEPLADPDVIIESSPAEPATRRV